MSRTLAMAKLFLTLLVFSLGLFYGMLFAWRQMRSDGTRGDLYRAALAVDGRFGDGRFAMGLAEAMTNESGTVFVVRLGDVPDAPSSTVRVVVRRGERAVRIERAQDGEARPCGQQD